MKKLIVLLLGLVLIAGCWSTPKVKRIKKTPPPVESVESKNLTSQAVASLHEYLKKKKADEEVLELVKALSVKFGLPFSPLPYKLRAFSSLAQDIRETTEGYKKAYAEWEKKRSSEDNYVIGGENKSTGDKIKSSIGWGIVILIIWAVLAPASLAFVAKWVHSKVKKAKNVLEDEFEQVNRQKQKLHKASNHTYSSIEIIKQKDPELWEKIKPYLKTNDIEVQSIIKEVVTNSNSEALEKK